MENLSRTTKDFTQEDKARLIEQHRNSGLDPGAFAREHNINEKTFRNWVYFANNPDLAKRRFTPVERKKAVEAFLASGVRQDEFCRAWGIGNSTLSKWLTRYEEFGSDGLMHKRGGKDDKRCGTKIPASVQDEIIALKKKEPGFGIKKVSQWLYRFRGVKVSPNSVRKTVTREGLPLAKKTKKKRRSSERVRRFERARPMQLWQSDITQYTMGPSSMRVYLTVFMDDHSRYIVGWRLQSRQTAELVIDAFKDACVRFGKPEEVLTDQGRQYFAWRGKSELEKLLEKEGIKHVVSRAHHPQTLGKCERFWETVTNEFWTRAKPQDLEEARQRLKYFIDHYNHHRPHQGIDGQIPADRFFGVAQDVREAIEKTVEQNALNMALGELPKAPAFLIGQVGDQRIAFHGTAGKFYLTHENLEGVKCNGESTSNANDTTATTSAISTGIGNDGDERREPRVDIEDETPLPPVYGDKLKSEVPGDSGEGFMGEGNSRGSGESQRTCPSDNGVLDGPSDEGSGARNVIDEADKILADDQPSDCGINSGVIDTATL